MKTSNLLILVLLIVTIISFNNKVVSVAPPLEDSSSSSSGCAQIHTDCAGQPSGCESEFGVYDPETCTCVCPDSVSDSESVALSNDFTGVWKSKPATSTISSSGAVPPSRLLAHIEGEDIPKNPVTLKLCVKDGELEGTIHQAMVFNNGMIISQEAVSASEVNIIAESKDGETLDANIKLTSERELLFTYEDGHDFTARKNNNFKACLAMASKPPSPVHSMSSMSGSGMSSNDKEAPRPPTGAMFGGEEWGVKSPTGTSGAPGLITETGIPARMVSGEE